MSGDPPGPKPLPGYLNPPENQYAQQITETTAETVVEEEALLGETGLSAAEVGVCAAGFLLAGGAMIIAYNRQNNRGQPIPQSEQQSDVETGGHVP